tara:strand:- start:34819 stop:35124 length:306 start_codon:yes stop_codon:yes gene_type:complete
MTELNIEVAFALPEKQHLINLQVPGGTTISDVLHRREVVAIIGEAPSDNHDVGVWGRVVNREQRVREGDRVEIYRPLMMDPREARRRHAAAGLTMRDEYDA